MRWSGECGGWDVLVGREGEKVRVGEEWRMC